MEPMKRCRACGETKASSGFYTDRTRLDGLTSVCKSCKKLYDKGRYEDWRSWLNDLKSKPCTDCGNVFDPVCMDFDHVGTGKTFSIARASQLMRGVAGRAKVLAEIAKCELVCANCHRLRTKERYS